MPLPLIPILIGVAAAAGGGTGAYLLWRRAKRPRLGAIPAQQMLTLAAQRVTPISARREMETILAEKREAPPAEPAPKPFHVSEENGWQPVWLHKAEEATLEWGFCLWDLIDAQTDARMYDESAFAQRVAGLIGSTVSWVIDYIKKKFIDISICYRFEIPALRIELADGRSFWLPSEPEGGTPGDIQGWNPYSSRPGFPATIAKWPLGPTPPGEIGGFWIRPLGDLWDWATWDHPVEVYQIVMVQDGVMKSFPAMSRGDWRIALMLGGQTPAPGLTEIYPGGVVKWFKDWRWPGQKYKMRPATRRKIKGMFVS